MISELALIATFFLALPLASAIAQVDTDAGDEAPVSGRGGKAAVAPEADCDTFGIFANTFAGTTRYRGNIYRIEFPTKLKEIKMELSFTGTTDLHVAIHRKEPNGEYKRYPDQSTDIVIPNAEGTGAPTFYTTGELDEPLDLEAGFDYAIAFAWGSKSVIYGRDEQGYPVPFRAGEVLGLVAVNLPPPVPPDPFAVPDTFPDLLIFPSGAYSMVLCFVPEKGACCSMAFGGCREVLKTECVDGGSFFHGEHIRCTDTPCIFGTCCDPCDGCHESFTSEACDLDRPDRHWTPFDCPVADPELLCPIVTGACCRGTTCTQECRFNCEHPTSPTLPGTYRGDGTDCSPNVCPGAVGACCVTGGCLNLTQASCTSYPGTYRGPGTTCLTLENECGGACCRGFASDFFVSCGHVGTRAECAPDPNGGGFTYNSYRGDGTICPDLTPNPNDKCDDLDEVACCLPDGSCINMTAFYCRASWVEGEPHPGLDCEEQPTLCSSLISCCFSGGRCELMTPNGCTEFGGNAGAGTTCAINACAAFIPTGACCGNTLGQCVVRSEAQCNALGDLYQGDGTNCNTPATACPGFGACCFGDGACLNDASSAQCTSLGGEYQSDDSACDAPTVDCDERGACCAITGTCQFITESQCHDIDPIPGVFRGVGVACAADTCGGACCRIGSCQPQTPLANCRSTGGAYQGVDVECGANLCVLGACCDGIACSSQTRHTCERDGGTYLGDGVDCNETVCALGACCQSDMCFKLQAPLCAQQNGVFLGEGVSCAVNSCPAGACCLTTGCQVRNIPDCSTSGGVFQDVDVACTQNLCVVGACCNGDTCSSQTRHTCVRDGGTYLGDGVACSGTVCTLGACCQEASCTPLQAPLCAQQNGVFLGEGVACDSSVCTLGACCRNESCTQLRALQCTQPDDVFLGQGVNCEAGICNTGACCLAEVCRAEIGFICNREGGTYLENGAACDVDTCTPGACCDGVACSSDIRFSCVGDGHVFNGPRTSCADPNPCPCAGDAQCDDGDACTTDSCDPATGCVNAQITCEDGNACTTNSCDPATGCVFTPVDCDDVNVCTTDACDPASGCTYANNNLTCDDGNDCTPNDRCENGSCVNDWHKGAAEFILFAGCLAGPNLSVAPECQCFDLDGDNDVDLGDVSQFFLAFESP